MRPSRRAVSLALIVLTAAPALAQSPAATPRPVRVILASGRLATVVDTPQYFHLLRVTIPPGQSSTYSGPSGMLYVVSGAIDVGSDGDRRSLHEGGAVFVPGQRPVAMTAAASGPAVALHWVLAPTGQAQAWHGRPATVADVQRSAEPLQNLKPGPHEFTMVRVTVDKGVPAPPMHHRSGAALYYVHAGAWTIHMVGKDEPRGRGASQLEPNGFVHTWELVGDAPGVLLQANISAEGTPEIIWLPR